MSEAITGQQLDLIGAGGEWAAEFKPLTSPDMLAGATLQERFEAFHAENPHVYTALRRRALAVKERGVKHYGIAALFEVLRFSALMTTGEEWKLNNSYRAFFARKLMAEVPELEGFFEIRTSVADKDEADGAGE
jgi:hypothetical protein